MTEVGTQSRLALHAAVSVADRAGYAVADARVLADSNHTIVWLRPHQILAKVGRRSAERLLLREHRVARALGEVGAPVVPPLSGVKPTRDPDTALLVTLWPRVEHLGEDSADAADVGQSLGEVHRALDRYDGELPSFLDKLEDARALLGDDARMSALDPDNRRWLRTAFDAVFDELRSRRYAVRGLHGEPHGQNRLTTPAGVRWIDFEGACLGPVEWDLAFLPDASLPAYPPPDEALVQLLRTLNSARTATLCWARYDVPALRWHARFHLQQLRKSPGLTPRSSRFADFRTARGRWNDANGRQRLAPPDCASVCGGCVRAPPGPRAELSSPLERDHRSCDHLRPWYADQLRP